MRFNHQSGRVVGADISADDREACLVGKTRMAVGHNTILTIHLIFEVCMRDSS